MVGWHHGLDGHEFELAPEVDGQGSLVCCNTWGHKESDTTEQLNCTELIWSLPGQGVKLMSPALAGGFLTTAPPRKSQYYIIFECC